MEDHALVFICQERGDGSRVLEEAVRLWPDGRVDHLGRPEHDLHVGRRRARASSAWSTKGTLRLGDVVVEVEPVLPVHIGVGTGYGFDGDGWKHGAYQGDLVVQGKVWDLSTDEGRSAMFGIVDSVAKFTSRRPGRLGPLRVPVPLTQAVQTSSFAQPAWERAVDRYALTRCSGT